MTRRLAEARDTTFAAGRRGLHSLLMLPVRVAKPSPGIGRTTVLQGAVHLVIFATYLFTTLFP